MKKISNKIKVIKKIPILFLIIAIFSIVTISCNNKKDEEDPNVFYTCSMDPQVMEKKPGKCPICKMELTKTIVNPKNQNNSLKLSDTQMKLANIMTQEVKSSSMSEGLTLRGTVVPDGKKVDIISSRVPGRLEKLFFKNKGEQVNKGDKIYEIYSEELQAAIKQYEMVKEKARNIKGNGVNYNDMLNSAKDKLITWGLTEKQIANLNSGNQLVPFYSNRSGVVTDLVLSEGNYVSEGGAIFTISNYSSVWVEAEVYPDDLKFIFPGAKVKVIVEAFPNEEIEGKVSFENPELESQSRFSLVRIEIANPEKKIKPGMRATVTVFPEKITGISIPESAVLYEPGMSVVWIQTNKGEFISKMVETGKKTNGMVEIKSGVKEGEYVVVSGAYLLNSEYLLRKGASSMTSMPGMDHGTAKESAPVHQH